MVSRVWFGTLQCLQHCMLGLILLTQTSVCMLHVQGSKPSSPTAKQSGQAATTLHRHPRGGRSLRTSLSGALTPPILSHSPRSSIDLTATPADIAAAAAAATAGAAGEPVSRSRKSFRASSRLAASSGSISGGVGGGLTVPLLSRIVSGRERYAPDAGSDEEDTGGEPDIEAGTVRDSQVRIGVWQNAHRSCCRVAAGHAVLCCDLLCCVASCCAGPNRF